MVCDPVAMSAPVLETVRASGVVTASDRVLALVSGGRDSVCLLDVLVRICGAGRVAVLHVDYGLRGAESDADARAVRDLCAALGVRCTVHAAPPSPASGNLQAWARDVRYARAAALAGDGGAAYTVQRTPSAPQRSRTARASASDSAPRSP